MSQPSPTPHTTWRPLLQSSPRESQPFPGGRTGGRKRLQRASSAESITLSGLSGWRRQPKQQKRTSPISYAQSTNTVPNVGKGEERTSLGMGMTCTPAKRRTLSRKASIRATSTPKAGRRRLVAEPRPSLSKLDSLRSTSDIPVDTSSQTLTSPSISGTEIEPIRVGEPPSTHDLTCILTHQREMENEPGFVTSQDMVVPLNDVDPHPLKDPDHAVRATISDQTADTTTSTAEVAELHALASRPDKHHVEPINVSTRLSGASNSDRDITVPLNDLSVATYTMPKASQTVSKITQRQSTPYRSRRTPRTSKTSERSEDLSLESARNQTEDDEADNQVGRKEEHPLGMAPVDDTWLVAVSFPSPPVTPNHSIAVHPLADTGATRLPGMTVTRPLTPRLKQREVFSTRGSSELGLSGALVNRPREIPNVNKEDERSSGRPSPDFWETEGNWRDPFGFWLLCLHVTSNFTGPYHTSVPARHLVQRCPTPSSFSSMSYRNSEASNLSTEVSSQQPSSPVKTGWKGAQVLARMEGKVDQSFSQRQRAKELFKKRRGDKRASRVCRKRRTSSIDLSDGEGSERAKRIIHYEDLRMNHQLAVEEVWD